jgi:general secretion pathway protein J
VYKVDLKKTGFTLVEVMVAVTIGGFIMLVAVGTLRAITSSAEMVETNINAAAEVRYAINLISRDLVNFYRDEDIKNTKLIGITDESGDGNVSYLVFYTINRMKARADEPEGDIYEVEYSLRQDGEKSLLLRRLWPNPNTEYDEYDDPHGIQAVIAEDIEVFEVRYFDGEEWSNEWPEEMEVLPQLIEVSIVGKEQSRGTFSMESIMINLTRSVTAAVAASEDGEQGSQGSSGQGGNQGGSGGGQGGSGQGGQLSGRG